MFGACRRLLRPPAPQLRRCISNSPRLNEVGRLLPASTDAYAAGQYFIHKLHGYRGVVLTQWDTQLITTADDGSTTSEPARYYVALADVRDYASQHESCTYGMWPTNAIRDELVLYN